MAEFERRQLMAIEKQLEGAFAGPIMPVTSATVTAPQTRCSASDRA